MSARGHHGLLMGGLSGPATDPYFANVVSLLHFDGADGSTTITDQTGRVWTRNGNAQIDTAQSKFGGSSLLLDGSGDFLRAASTNDWDIGSSDYTAECWIRLAVLPAIQSTILDRREASGSATGWTFAVASTGALIFFGYSSAGVLAGSAGSSAGAIAAGSTTHVAFTRSGATYRIFGNGVKLAEGTETLPISGNSRPLNIGRQGDRTDRDFNGWIDELRITKGVARYTADFTPPSAAFPNS